MTQPIDIITRAMKDIGAVAAGEVPPAMTTAQRMLKLKPFAPLFTRLK